MNKIEKLEKELDKTKTKAKSIENKLVKFKEEDCLVRDYIVSNILLPVSVPALLLTLAVITNLGIFYALGSYLAIMSVVCAILLHGNLFTIAEKMLKKRIKCLNKDLSKANEKIKNLEIELKDEKTKYNEAQKLVGSIFKESNIQILTNAMNCENAKIDEEYIKHIFSAQEKQLPKVKKLVIEAIKRRKKEQKFCNEQDQLTKEIKDCASESSLDVNV